jgi:hypothetical protein
MCKEKPVIPVDKVLDQKKNNRENNEGWKGGETQGTTDPKSCHQKIEKSSFKMFQDDLWKAFQFCPEELQGVCTKEIMDTWTLQEPDL